MIILNAEKELVRVESWSDILERPDYVSDINPASVKLEAIIGSYALADDVRCGLSTCHTPHKRGYLVSTTSGNVTNIGNVCGKKYFSVDFESLRRIFDREVRVKTQKETIRAFQSRIPDLANAIETLKSGEFGATWVQRNIKRLKAPSQELPEVARRMLLDLARTSQNTIYTRRLATEKEIEDLEAIEHRDIKRPHYISEVAGILVGLSALLDENDLREIVVKDLEAGIERLTSLDLEKASPYQLQLESKWTADFDTKFERATHAVETAKMLLTKSNLGQLMSLLPNERDRKRLRAAISDLPEEALPNITIEPRA